MKPVEEKARHFLYRCARPLDMARYQFHFQGGSREGVLKALAAYQNGDGGFGHALEADCWNPHSSPIQTWAATEILREVGETDPRHPMVQGILRYLLSGADFDGHCWANVVKTNDDFPHAPWWRMGSVSICHADYNPTACLAGFLLRFSSPGTPGFALGLRVAGEAWAAYQEKGLWNDMHVSACYIRLLEYARAAAVPDGPAFQADALEERLRAQVSHSITRDRAAWERGYICRPSQFIDGLGSPFYAENAEIAQYECDFIEKTQQPDGAWPIPWNWGGDYPEEWAVSRVWWQGTGAVNQLLYLKGMGRLD